MYGRLRLAPVPGGVGLGSPEPAAVTGSFPRRAVIHQEDGSRFVPRGRTLALFPVGGICRQSSFLSCVSAWLWGRGATCSACGLAGRRCACCLVPAPARARGWPPHVATSLAACGFSGSTFPIRAAQNLSGAGVGIFPAADDAEWLRACRIALWTFSGEASVQTFCPCPDGGGSSSPVASGERAVGFRRASFTRLVTRTPALPSGARLPPRLPQTGGFQPPTGRFMGWAFGARSKLSGEPEMTKRFILFSS